LLISSIPIIAIQIAPAIPSNNPRKPVSFISFIIAPAAAACSISLENHLFVSVEQRSYRAKGNVLLLLTAWAVSFEIHRPAIDSRKEIPRLAARDFEKK
jgi:hypothetical protein